MPRLPDDPQAARARRKAEMDFQRGLEQERREAAIFQASVKLHSKKPAAKQAPPQRHNGRGR